jgi:hypothetical protein
LARLGAWNVRNPLTVLKIKKDKNSWLFLSFGLLTCFFCLTKDG